MNEILGMASHAVFRDLVKEAQAAKYFSIICDKTADVSIMEQLPYVFVTWIQLGLLRKCFWDFVLRRNVIQKR